MSISDTEPSSVILSQLNLIKMLKNGALKVPKQDEAKRDCVINPESFYHGKF